VGLQNIFSITTFQRYEFYKISKILSDFKR